MNYLDLTFSTTEEILSFPFNDETLLVPAPNNLADLESIVAVNDTGYIFWQELMTGLTPNEICRKWSKISGIELPVLQDLVLEMLCIMKPFLKENFYEAKV